MPKDVKPMTKAQIVSDLADKLEMTKRMLTLLLKRLQSLPVKKQKEGGIYASWNRQTGFAETQGTYGQKPANR